MSVVVSALVTRVEKRLRIVAGVSAQLYAEDTILHSIQTSFDRLFKIRWWPMYTTALATYTLDGTTGKVTTDLTALIKHFTDIQRIWYDEDEAPLTRLRTDKRPDKVTGTNARYWEPLKQEPTRVFRVIPITTTGDVHVRFKTKPDDFLITDTIYLDPLLLELAASYEYVVTDGANPGQAEMLLGMLKQHFAVVDAEQDDDYIELVHGLGSIPNVWH